MLTNLVESHRAKCTLMTLAWKFNLMCLIYLLPVSVNSALSYLRAITPPQILDILEFGWLTYNPPHTPKNPLDLLDQPTRWSLSMPSLDHWEGSRLQKWEEDSCLWWQIWGMCLPILFLRIRTHDQFQESWYRGLEKVHLSGTDAGFVHNWRRFLQTTKKHIQSLAKKKVK